MTKKEAVKWAELFLAYANGKEVKNTYGDSIEKLEMCVPDYECLNNQSVEDFAIVEKGRITDVQKIGLNEAIETINKYCTEEICSDCPFHIDGYDGCKFRGIPCDWETIK